MAIARIGLAVALAGGVLTWWLSPVPFGALFRTSLWAAVGGTLIFLVGAGRNHTENDMTHKPLILFYQRSEGVFISGQYLLDERS